MENNIITNSIGIGGIIFAGLILFWFVSVYLKRRMTLDQSNQRLSTLNKINWEEKREHPRVVASWQASIESSRGTDQVQLKDISLGGAFVFCRQPLPLKEKFKITLRLPNNGPLSLNGEVVWSNANVPEDKVVNRGMGVRFIENTEQDQKQLKDAISAEFEKSDIPMER